MLRLFRRRRRGLLWSHPVLDRIATRVRTGLGRASIWLQKQTATWSKAEWYIVMVVFCAVTLLVCSWIVKDAVVHPGAVTPHEAPVRPVQHFRPESIVVDPAEMLNTLLADKQYLDSLRIHDAVQFDGLIKIHPALVDSLDALIHLYQAPLK